MSGSPEDGKPRPVSASPERLERTRLANVRQELMAPASAIMGYADLLLEEARKQTFTDMLPDLERIAQCGSGLLEHIDRVLVLDDEAAMHTDESLAGMQTMLRHDLRNPLNAIKGYSELLLEELEELGGEALRVDLLVLLGEANRLLSQIDQIVDFSHSGHEPIDSESKSSIMAADFVDAMRPLSPGEVRRHETGRILVVDDNDSNRGLLSRRLSRDGHQVFEAISGRTALDLLSLHVVDLILLDLLMPEMNGFQVLAELKRDERLRGVPVVIISGLTDMDGIIRCIEAGAEDYLTKPINSVLLNARINACLERKRWRDREQKYLSEIKIEKDKSETLLLNILPPQIVARLNSGEELIADRFDDVTVLFADLVGFTEISSRMSPSRLVEDLNHLMSEFDMLAQNMAVEKIKTIGDAYMAATGVPDYRQDHVEAMADFALGMLRVLDIHNQVMATTWKIRIGVHCGPVVAGIIGKHKFIYDIWGDTVNHASRLEATSDPDWIHVSAPVADVLRSRFKLESRGIVHLRGKSDVPSFFLVGRQ
ncbi:MAG TPA: adenylate/guanylate cyclase domain-containing protein [Kiloniellales bacterium]